jgi:hypothetical protein
MIAVVPWYVFLGDDILPRHGSPGSRQFNSGLLQVTLFLGILDVCYKKCGYLVFICAKRLQNIYIYTYLSTST